MGSDETILRELNLSLHKQIDELGRGIERLKAERASSLDRDFLGQLVRMAWVEWAEQHPNPKPHWLTPWQSLPEEIREVDRQIGEKVARCCVTPELLRVEQRAEQAEQRIAELEREVAEYEAENQKLSSELQQRCPAQWDIETGDPIIGSPECPRVAALCEDKARLEGE